MPVKNIQEQQIGNVGFPFAAYYILTTNTLAEVTEEGYLNSAKTLFNVNFQNGDFANVYTTDMDTIYLQVVVEDGNYSLFNPYSGNGTVSSVGLAAPSFLTVTNSPVTTTGTITLSLSGTALPVSSGGTNSAAALTNGRLMISNAGAIVESNANASMNGFRITSLATPTSASDATTKAYVDSLALSGFIYQGNWDASTNTPTLTAGVGTVGFAYYVSVAGTQTVPSGTATTYEAGDAIVYGADLIWNKIDRPSSTVVSINGAGGVLTLAGTSNQVSVSTLGTTLTLATPQDIGASSSPTFSGMTLSGLTASTALISNGSKAITSSVTTSTELGYVSGVTSSIQTQLNAKGTVSSVAMTVPAFLSVSGSPITTTGTLAVSLSGTALPVANGGTGSNLSATGGASQVLRQSSAGAVVTVSQLAASDLSNGVTGSGAVVLASSPSLTTPNIGSATASNLTMSTGGALRTSTSDTNTLLMQAYDVNDATYRTFGTLTAGNTPTCSFSQPSGGTMTWDGGAIGATTQANAQFYSPMNAQTGTTYTLLASDCGKTITLSNAAAITVTLPQQSTTTTAEGFWCRLFNIGAGTVTIVKQGAETLIGNTTLITNAECLIQRITTTTWSSQYGTAVVNMVGMATINLSITTSNTKDLWCPQSPATLLGIRFRAFSVGTAGTFKLQLNGADITGLTGLVPSTTQAYSYASSATALASGDVITIVADGTLVNIADLNITPIYTVTY